MTQPLIVGLGSHHGDDQAGWLVLEQLQARGYPASHLFRLRKPADLLDVFDAEQTWTRRPAHCHIESEQVVGWDQRRFAAPAHHHVSTVSNGGPALEASLSHPTLIRATDLTERPDCRNTFIICDACVGDEPPGTIHSLSWPTDKLVYQRPSGSHDLSLADVMELGQRLGSLPETVQIWTVQAGSWSPGLEPSLEVQSAAARVADAIWKDHQRA